MQVDEIQTCSTLNILKHFYGEKHPSNLSRILNRNYFRASQFFFFFLVATLLLQCHVNELGRLAEIGPEDEVFAVRSLHAVILDAGAAVELWPRVDVLGAMGCVQHMRYPQICECDLILGRLPVENEGGGGLGAVAPRILLVPQAYRSDIFLLRWLDTALVCGNSFSAGSTYCS